MVRSRVAEVSDFSSPFKPCLIEYLMKINRGLNLLELMIGIAVVTALAVMAVPSFDRLIASTRVNAQATELLSALLYVRSEALKRNVNVSICQSAAPAAPMPSCSQGPNGWASGWVVFTDGGISGTVDGTDVVLRAGQPAPAITLALSPAYSRWLGFSPTGRPRVEGGGAGNGMIFICSNSLRRSISISLVGRVARNDTVADSQQCDAP
jgi:type IV fimbrial biogenesis protein FimT